MIYVFGSVIAVLVFLIASCLDEIVYLREVIDFMETEPPKRQEEPNPLNATIEAVRKYNVHTPNR